MKEVGLMCIVISQIPESLHCVICFTVCQPKFFPITCVLRLPEVFLPQGSVIATFCHYLHDNCCHVNTARVKLFLSEYP